MIFKNLCDKFHYYRDITDYRLIPNSYSLIFLDGRSFSKMIKNKFEKPFDNVFIDMMNKTAVFLLEKVQGAKIAFTQSDEILLFVSDAESEKSDVFFGGRLCKINSICASLATCEFNKQLLLHNINNLTDSKAIKDCIEETKYCQFDCKAWNVPNLNEVFAAYLYRSLDCIKNSKNQTAQTYISHKKLVGKTADECIQYLLETNGIDWNNLPDGMKYGRFIVKKEVNMEKDGEFYTRRKQVIIDGFPLNEEGNKEKFFDLLNIK